MKKITLTLAILTLGSTFLATASTQVLAADKLSGSTAAKSVVTKGDLLFTPPDGIDFKSQKLTDGTINFEQVTGTGGKVTDYTGDTTGYAITANVADLDKTGLLSANGKLLNDKETAIVLKADTVKTDKFGDNAFNPKFDLSYKGLEHLISGDKATITWTLSKTDPAAITE